jgi:hypothetical protein
VIVEFDKGTVVVETSNEKPSRDSLWNAIVTTLLTTHAPRAVERWGFGI